MPEFTFASSVNTLPLVVTDLALIVWPDKSFVPPSESTSKTESFPTTVKSEASVTETSEGAFNERVGLSFVPVIVIVIVSLTVPPLPSET